MRKITINKEEAAVFSTCWTLFNSKSIRTTHGSFRDSNVKRKYKT